VIFLLFIGLFLAFRVYFRTPAQSGDIVQGDYFVSGFLVLFFMSFTTGLGSIGLFRSRAEARFIIGSPIPPLIAIPYLQLRDAIVQSWNVLFRMAYFVFLFAPRSLSGVQSVLNMLLLLAGVVAMTTVVLPRRLAPRPLQILAVVAGVPLTLLCAEPSIRGILFQLHPSPEALAFAFRYLPAWHPGELVLHPSIVWFAIALGTAAVAVLCLMLCSRDAYPELYALSMARIDATEKVKAHRSGRDAAVALKRRNVQSSKGQYAPAGLLIFVWKAYVEFRRFALSRIALGTLCITMLGGYAFSRFAPDAFFYTMLINFTFSGAIVTSGRGAMTLALELRRPLFWLSHGTLLARLAAVCTGRLLQPAVTAGVFLIGVALAGKSPDRLLVIGLGLPAYLLLQQAVGILVFSISPRAIDLKGPLGLVRILLALVSFVAPGIAYGLTAWLAGGAVLPAILAGDGVALAESAAFLAIAAARLESVGDRLSAT
jgi:hypothetical protein